MIVNKSFLSASKPARLYYMGTKVSSRPKWPFWTKHFNTERTHKSIYKDRVDHHGLHIYQGEQWAVAVGKLIQLSRPSPEKTNWGPQVFVLSTFSLFCAGFLLSYWGPQVFVLATFSFFCRGFLAFVLRRILCGGFRKCFGLVVERSTDKGRQALSLKYNRRTLLRWSATKRGDMLCFVRSLFIYFYLVSIFSIILAGGQTHSLPCF